MLCVSRTSHIAHTGSANHKQPTSSPLPSINQTKTRQFSYTECPTFLLALRVPVKYVSYYTVITQQAFLLPFLPSAVHSIELLQNKKGQLHDWWNAWLSYLLINRLIVRLIDRFTGCLVETRRATHWALTLLLRMSDWIQQTSEKVRFCMCRSIAIDMQHKANYGVYRKSLGLQKKSFFIYSSYQTILRHTWWNTREMFCACSW